MNESESPREHRESRESPFRYGLASEASNEHPDVNEDATVAVPERGIFAVFDGMGGHAAGEVASAMARDRVLESLNQLPPEASKDEVAIWLQETMKHIDAAISRAGDDDGRLRGMGTTGSLAVIRPVQGQFIAYIANAGDTRAWHQRGDIFTQETLDNITGTSSPESRTISRRIQEQLNLVTEESELLDPQAPLESYFRRRNYVQNILGARRYDPYIIKIELCSGDRLILTSDGVHDNLSSRQMAEILNGELSPDDGAQRLVQRARDISQQKTIRSKPDDMTALVIEFPER